MARIGMSQNMRQAQRQEMLLLPRMLQAVEVLQLPITELRGYLLSAFEENEALALDEEAPAEAPEPRDSHPPERRGTREDSDRHADWLANQPDRSTSLSEAVERQLGMLEVDPALLPWVRLLVDALDENGYLSVPDENLMAMASERGFAGDTGTLGRAIAALQGLEPRGIGGRNAVEALLLQLDPEDSDYALSCTLLEDFLEELARNKLPGVAKAMGIEMERLQELLERLKDLELRPAARLVGNASPTIRPDVLVQRSGDGFEVSIDQSGLPPVRIDPGVRTLVRDRGLDADVRRRLRGKLDQARWLLEAIEQRRETLHRIATAVFARQTPFLEHGSGNLQPLRMNQVARWLGVHTSTVSRAVAGKYAQTPQGIFPLRYFFQGSGGATEDVARDDVREEVRRVVADEDPAVPLSDDEIAKRMKERGFELARRTVAKYRKELGIPSSYRRRKY